MVFPNSVDNPGAVVIPPEAMTVLDIYPLQDVTEESVKDNYRGQLMQQGGAVNNVLFEQIMSGFSSITEVIASIAQALGAIVPPGVKNAADALGSLATHTANALKDVTDAAVNAVIDGINGIGSFAHALTSAIMEFIHKAVNSIFGDGGTKWGQEMLVAAGPVVEGTNDLPLGFAMNFHGTIDEVLVRTSENLVDPEITDSKIVFQIQVNNVVRGTFTLNPGIPQQKYQKLDIKAGKDDIVTVFVTEATAMVADLTVSVRGRYN